MNVWRYIPFGCYAVWLRREERSGGARVLIDGLRERAHSRAHDTARASGTIVTQQWGRAGWSVGSFFRSAKNKEGSSDCGLRAHSIFTLGISSRAAPTIMHISTFARANACIARGPSSGGSLHHSLPNKRSTLKSTILASTAFPSCKILLLLRRRAGFPPWEQIFVGATWQFCHEMARSIPP